MLHFQTDTSSFVNDLTRGMFIDDFENNYPFKKHNIFNAMSVSYEAAEGKVIVFPARLDHMTTAHNGSDIETADVDIIKKRRISISGDFLITYKNAKHTSMGLQPVKNWRNFG